MYLDLQKCKFQFGAAAALAPSIVVVVARVIVAMRCSLRCSLCRRAAAVSATLQARFRAPSNLALLQLPHPKQRLGHTRPPTAILLLASTCPTRPHRTQQHLKHPALLTATLTLGAGKALWPVYRRRCSSC